MERPKPAPIGPEHERELLKDAHSYVYKSTDHGELVAHFFYPEGHQAGQHRTAVMFFHSGLWDKPMVTQFVPQALHFTTRDAVGIVVEYRVSQEHGTSPLEAIRDAQSALVWLRKNHEFFGVDPERIVAGGAGSGAHLALCAALHKSVENDGFYDARPNALLLYSAITDTSKKGVGLERFIHPRDSRQTNPLKFIRKKLPPSMFFHGNEDTVVPVTSVERFVKKMKAKRNICRFFPFPRATHSFFNFNVSQEHFVTTLESADGFLSEQGFLEGTPEGF